MKKPYKKISLTNKLSFLVVLSVLISFVVLGFYFDSFLKENYLQNTQKRMLHGYQRIAHNLTTIIYELQKSIAFVQSDESLLASIDLINNYQDKQNYNAILLDEEKKSITEQLLDRVKLSLNNDIALYDKQGELIAFVTKETQGYHLNFISYEKGKIKLYSKYEHEELYHSQPFSEYKLIYFKHRSYYEKQDALGKAIVTFQSYQNELFIKSHRHILAENAVDIIAHIEMSYLMGADYFIEISNVLNMNVTTTQNNQYASRAVPLLNKEAYEKFNIIQSNEYYLGVMSIHTLNGDIYLLASLQKSLLKITLDENRQKLLIILLIVISTIVFILRFLFLRILAKPLNALLQQINKIGHRDYSIAKQLNSGDELETISKNINDLASIIRTREISLQESQANLKYLSNHDPLTDLPNRRFFSAILQHSLDLASRNQTQVAVLFLDLDKFKDINDLLGHNIGDELLKVVSQRLISTLRRADTLARIGGDEFHILIESIKNSSEVDVIVKKILNAFQTSFFCESHELKTTASIGIAIYPRDGKDPATLIKNADLAMYKSKEEGRNSFNYFSKELSEHLQEKLIRVNALKSAIENCDEFTLLYQPKISVHSEQIVAVEALIRWHSKELGFVRPDQFIALAEETNLIVPLGRWILQQACNDFVTLQQQGYLLENISINVSNVQLQHSDMLLTLKQILNATGINPKQVELEITESYIATSQQKALQTLWEIRAMNIDLAIDDFGTGYSSLSYLQKLPVTRLKIDKSFVDHLPESQESIAIAKAIIALAKTFNLAITAEGVENEAQLEFLKNAQCDEIQGYFYAKPLSIEELKTFYKANIKAQL